MARTLMWDELQPGMDVWEDWVLGYGTIHKKVLRRNGDQIWLIRDGVRTVAYWKNKNIRYWDAEPTRDERRQTPWRRENE